MKTAISVPDATFAAATERARNLGISRSEFFATAARRYLEELDNASLTAHIDEALDVAGDDDSARVAAQVGRRRLAADDSDW